MKKFDIKTFSKDVLIDILGGILIAVGIYNFAANAGFPLAGVSGISLVIYRLFGLPIGWVTIVLNIPIAIACFKILGRDFFVRSVKTILITSIIVDYIAPLFPLYSGDRMLAAICTGIFSGLGYTILFLNNTSTGGTDFITLSIRARHPHLSLGRIVFISDTVIVLFGGAILRDIDATIYGIIITYLITLVIDKLMYGIDSGKMTLIITKRGQKVAEAIDQHAGRGATILTGKGSYSGEEKEIVLCACNNKQMNVIKKIAKEVDPMAFTVIVESNEVIGEGFKQG
ncbi:MAG: YitT family protein [Hespellia sp.]|nr:YitT family protein [Hespellia sp.]